MVPDERQTFSPKEIVDRHHHRRRRNHSDNNNNKKRHCTRQHREMRAGYRSHQARARAPIPAMARKTYRVDIV